MDTPTLQDRLRAAADVYSDQPPIFGLFFEAADALDEAAGQLNAARADMLREGIRTGEIEAGMDALLSMRARESQVRARTGPTPAHGPCCARMRAALGPHVCPVHPSPSECPDSVIGALADGRIGLRIHDGGSAVLLIAFCPWCGAPLTPSYQQQPDRPCDRDIDPPHFRYPWLDHMKKLGRLAGEAIDRQLALLEIGQSLAVSMGGARIDGSGRASIEAPEFVFLNPGEKPPLGKTWTVYGPITAELRAMADPLTP